MKKIKYGIVITVVIAILIICLSGCCAHQFTETIIEPSCAEEGYTLHECSVCGRSYKSDTVKKKEHTETDWIIEKEETCTENGSKYKECTICGQKTKTQTIAKSHNFKNNKCVHCGEINPEFPYILTPETPITLQDFTYSGRLASTFIIQNIDIENQLFITSYYYTAVTFTLEKISDTEGVSYSRICKFGYKVYDGNTDVVVESGTVYTEAISVGDKSAAKISLINLEEGKSYRLELLNAG